MEGYIITTDNNSDLPDSYCQEHQVGCTYLSYSMEGKTYTKENFLPTDEFYAKMRGGALPTTAQVNPAEVKGMMEPYLEEGKDILHLAFSSGLSGSYDSCLVAAEELAKKYPQRKILVLDSLCASLGQGLLVHYAVKMKEAGKSMGQVAEWVKAHRLNLVHMFTVDDLDHLHRGGRVSKATAIVGGMLNIKPVLHVDDAGKLVAIGKVRGRKKSLQALVEGMQERIGSYKDQCDTIFISHGDCLEDARYVENKVRELYPIQTVLINYVGATIGAHSGPGTVALFFLGDRR